MKTFLMIAIFLGVWIALQVYILPKLGISTWMSDACQVTGQQEKDDGKQEARERQETQKDSK